MLTKAQKEELAAYRDFLSDQTNPDGSRVNSPKDVMYEVEALKDRFLSENKHNHTLN